jgi:hypothetical protein
MAVIYTPYFFLDYLEFQYSTKFPTDAQEKKNQASEQ